MNSCDIIGEHTITQINAILSKLPEQLEIRVGMPGLFGGGGGGTVAAGTGKIDTENAKPPKLSELQSFCAAFTGIS